MPPVYLQKCFSHQTGIIMSAGAPPQMLVMAVGQDSCTALQIPP